ncbi:aminotransferase class V-fold PLP-dependent enzyme [Nostocoides sp. HKS02]|uniref:pyridoxal phosphate-dependent decarboxylase family protein n=1 Tax=Nostocoides sp. HKS02 TaxID=1813880 RepID=UPI0012B4CA06|nr:aminotransferase class V-fold PLP-dependent enzyme [Tetrasphaera sp. HKS02]QGN57570.1 aminotransferase class V-fold PLP-dependent enzyme [Tetrasphaera sp. HKS02]
MDDLSQLFHRAAEVAAAHRASLPDRPVGAAVTADQLVAELGEPLRTAPMPATQVLEELTRGFARGLVATPGPRFFGFVIGGALPAASAADLVAVAWDQCAFNAVLSPAAAAAERIAAGWLLDVLGLPPGSSVGFVTGAQGANTAALAAARHHVLAQVGWDVERDGLVGAPRVRLVASTERHATIDRSLRLLGFGTAAVEQVQATANGAIDVADLERVLGRQAPGPTIVCLQSGNVNTGACDDLTAGCAVARRHGAWVHVDGAFGLWAAASPTTAHLTAGVEQADSWSCDAHKWLNVPYDCGFAICSRPQVHAAALSYSAAYLTGQGGPTPALGDLVMESSRRARGFAVWAALRELGRDGVADLVDRCCTLARRCADGLEAGGAEVVNDVVLNQVLIGFGDDARTDRVVEAVQREGTCWLGGTTWRGRRLMRVSVSNWSTTAQDIDQSVAAILRVAGQVA